MAELDRIFDLFTIGQRLNLPFLSNTTDSAPSCFVVKDVKRGGMGGCIRINGNGGADYAMKIILPERLSSEISVKRYIQELSKWRTFSMCDGILETLGIFDYEGAPCIISPWLNNGSLSCLMQLKERTVFYNTIHRIIGALDWVYTNFHTIHRDLKPDNILVDKDYLPYVADWGLAKTINIPDNNVFASCKDIHKSDENLTQENYFVGTASFASPEQLYGSHELDCRSDMFALGIIMYLWETGKHPFKTNSEDDLMYNICHGRFNKLGGICRRTNFGAEKIINKCLALSPNDRFSCYSELLSAIEKEGRDVPSFSKYQPKLRYYSNLVSPKDLGARISDNEISGFISKNTDNKDIQPRYIIVDEKNLAEQIQVATDLAHLGRAKEAVALLSKCMPDINVVRKFPDLPIHQAFVINYAWCFRQMGKIDAAINWIKTISKANFLTSTYFVNLSEFLLANADYTECIDICIKGLEQYPLDGDLLGNATLACICTEKYDQAETYAKRRLKVNPGVHAFYEYGYLCLNRANSYKEKEFPKAIDLYKNALSYFRKALAVNPKYRVASLNLGITYFKLRRYKDAIDVLSALTMSETREYWIAKSLTWGFSAKKCLDHCNSALKVFPNSIMLKRIKSECLVDDYVIGKTDADGRHFIEDSSWEFFASMVNNKKDRVPSDLRFYGKLLYWSEDYEKSVQFFDWAVLNYPEEWTYNFYSSYYNLYLGRYNEALNQALLANRKAPWRETTYQLLARCYGYLNDDINKNLYTKKFKELKSKKDSIYASCKDI